MEEVPEEEVRLKASYIDVRAELLEPDKCGVSSRFF